MTTPPATALPLGRYVKHDPASRGFDLAAAVAAQLPTEPIDWARNGPIFGQEVGCCTACAALGLMMTAPFDRGVHYTMDDVLRLYHDETVIDPFKGTFPPDDTGSNGLAAMKSLRAWGLITGYRHAFSPVVAVSALRQGPIAVGTVWLESMLEPRGGRVVVDRRSNGAGGHEYVIDAWDPRRSRVRITNSWTEAWGVGGRAWLDFPDFAWLLRQQGDAVQPVI